jgi:hypothetical protein
VERLEKELARNKAALEVMGKVPMTPLRVATVAG